MKTWLVVKNGNYQIVKSDSKPKNCDDVKLKIGDAVYQIDPNYATNDIFFMAVVEDLFVTDTGRNSEVTLLLKREDGSMDIAEGEYVVRVPSPYNWICKSYVTRQYRKHNAGLNKLKENLTKVWGADTALGEWNPECPSLNQCAVTALIVQDRFGGDLLRCKMTNDYSHYWNRLPNGREVDLTEDQFLFIEAQPLKDDFVLRERDYVLSFPNTASRYELLKSRLLAVESK